MKLNSLNLSSGTLQDFAVPNKSGVQNVQENQLAINGNDLVRFDSTSTWEPQVFLGELPLYDFTEFTFTTNKTGTVVPSLLDLRTLYSDAVFANNTEWFNVSEGVQFWTVPEDAAYRIETGSPSAGQYQQGAKVTLDAVLTKGTILRMLCGQNSGGGLCGGGASFCQIKNGALLAVAGGYGGNFVPFGTPLAANPIINLSQSGSGQGGSSATYAGLHGDAVSAGGSGWASPCGAAISNVAFVIKGTSLENGGAPGGGHNPHIGYAYGGFGGGGGGINGNSNQFRTIGGGAGYTGGNGSVSSMYTSMAGQGGTCYAAPAGAVVSNRTSSLQNTSNFGYVKITKLA